MLYFSLSSSCDDRFNEKQNEYDSLKCFEERRSEENKNMIKAKDAYEELQGIHVDKNGRENRMKCN